MGLGHTRFVRPDVHLIQIPVTSHEIKLKNYKREREDKDIVCVIWERKLISQKGPFRLFPAQRPHYRLTCSVFLARMVELRCLCGGYVGFPLVGPGSDAYFFGSETQILPLIGKPTDPYCWRRCLILQQCQVQTQIFLPASWIYISGRRLRWHQELNKITNEKTHDTCFGTYKGV